MSDPMRNPRAALSVVKSNWRRAAVVGVATVGIVGLSAGTGYTAAMVTSADIKDQTIHSRDVHAAGVGRSELRGAGAGTPAVNSHKMAEGAAKSFQIKDGSVHEEDLSDGVKGKLNNNGGGSSLTPGSTDSTTGKLDGTEQVPADQSTQLNALNVSAGTFVTAEVTLTGENHAVCSLVDGAGTHLAESDADLTDGAAHVTLTGVTESDGGARLMCHVGDGTGQATDISMASVQVAQN